MKRILILLTLFISQAIHAAVFSPEDIHKLKKNFFANIQKNGAILASPSKHDPNYYYDWTRDSAITMNLIERWYESTHCSKYKTRLLRYVTWTQLLQHQIDPSPNQNILGEPKFYIDGHPFEGPWTRPQNDGPALRALVMIHFAQDLLNHNETAYVQQNLYNKNTDPQTMGVINIDLDYTAQHWADKNFDLWEEVYGDHFFTAMAQQKALQEGAALARQLHDDSTAAYYEQQANLMNARLSQHLDQQNQLIQATIAPHPGPQKAFEVDTSIILGVLLHPQTGSLAPESIFVKNTVNELHNQFNLMFPINQNGTGPILFGRYPGDTYDGYRNNSKGNPWFILTATIAEYYFTLADNLAKNDPHNPLIADYLNTGDGYLKLIKKYAPGMRIDEQINLNTGVQQGARSLTWSYVSLIHALELREKVEQQLH